MPKKYNRDLISFRLDRDLTSFVREQARLQGISMTELVNRLMRWAIENFEDSGSSPSQQSISRQEIDDIWTKIEELQKIIEEKL